MKKINTNEIIKSMNDCLLINPKPPKIEFQNFANFDPLTKFNASIKALVEEQIIIEKDILSKSKWWFSPSMGDLNLQEFHKASKRYRNGDKASITQLFKIYFHENNFERLKTMVSKWSEHPLFVKRMFLINDALEAHIQKRYSLSIPVLIAQTEGIAALYCKEHGVYCKRSNGKDKINKAMTKTNSKTYHELREYVQVFLMHIEKTIYSDTKNILSKNRNRIINRHGILHGEILKYASPANSLRCFLLLDMLTILE